MQLILISWLLIFHVEAGASQSLDSLISEARSQMLQDPKVAADLLTPALTTALDRHNYVDAVPLLHQLAIVAALTGDKPKSQTLTRDALRYALMSGDDMLIANSLTKMARQYRNAGQPDSTVAACLDAIQHYTAASAIGYAWACYTLLGDINQDQGHLTDAEQYYIKAWEVVQTLDNPKEELIVAGLLQHFYLSTGNAEKYAAILENLLQRNPFFLEELHQGNAHYLSLLRTHQGNTESIEDVRKSVSLLRGLSHSASLVTSMGRLGKLLTMVGRYDEGFDTLRHALYLSTHSLPVRMTLYYMLYENRKAAGDLFSALEYFSNYHAAKDSINSANAVANIRELEVKFNTKEKELALLKEQERTRQRTSQRNYILAGAAVILWFALFGILFFWNRVRINRKLALQTEAINNQKIQQLEQKNKLLAMSSMIEGQEAERKRIAQDLHDGLGGLLSSVKVQLNLIQHHVAQLEASDLYRRANTLIDNASTELRRISHNMMPSSLSRLGLEAALEDLCSSLQSDHRLEVDLQIFGLSQRLNETSEIMLYRIVQELCNNVVKHAQASQLLVQINKTQDELFLIVEDNGIGMDKNLPGNTNGIGIKSIESRVRFLNGSLDIGKGSGKGTCVTVHFPVGEIQ